jgi:hypothetical protein
MPTSSRQIRPESPVPSRPLVKVVTMLCVVALYILGRRRPPSTDRSGFGPVANTPSLRALEPLDPKVLARRAVELTPVGYLTIVSIIQAVALSFLATNIFTMWDQNQSQKVLATVQSLALFILLVFVFHFYVSMTMFLRWRPSFLDSLVPFAIGAVEVPPVLLLGRSTPWMVSLELFWLFASLGLISTMTYSKREQFGSVDAAHYVLVRYLRGVFAVCLTMLLLIAFTVFLTQRYPQGADLWAGSAAVVSILGTVVSAWLTRLRVMGIFASYGFH